MARPRKKPEDKRTKVLSVRLTPSEYERVTSMGKDAGLLAGVYARRTILDKRPRSKPAHTIIFNNLLYEFQSIANNFQQLFNTTGDDDYLQMAKYVGGHLPEQLYGRSDLANLIEEHLSSINLAGHFVNSLAYKANAEIIFSIEEKGQSIAEVKESVLPLDLASRKPVEG